jgi:hypothetical protein
VTRREYFLLLVIATWAAVMLTGNAFGGEIYSCVDKGGKKRIQNNPCGSNEKTIDRQVLKESSRQIAPNSVSAPVTSGPSISNAPVPSGPSTSNADVKLQLTCEGNHSETGAPVYGECNGGKFTGYFSRTGKPAYGKCDDKGKLIAYDPETGKQVIGRCKQK